MPTLKELFESALDEAAAANMAITN